MLVLTDGRVDDASQLGRIGQAQIGALTRERMNSVCCIADQGETR